MDLRDGWVPGEPAAAFSGIVTGAIVAYLVYRFVRQLSWTPPFRLRFVLLNLGAAIALGVLWLVLSVAVESLFTGSLQGTRSARPLRLLELPINVLFLYAAVATIAYTMARRERAAQSRTEAARAQLAALRAQLQPHFLFNALHTVVQLIPIDPARAGHAAELVASLLRETLEEGRDLVTLGDEWSFVSRYLEVEHIRFGERLRVRAELDPELLEEQIPSFALQALVENAVHHGAARRVAPTEIVVTAESTGSDVVIAVRNTGDGPSPTPIDDGAEHPPASGAPSARAGTGTGTGLSRLRERLTLLYGDRARLIWGPRDEGGFEATLVVPRGRRVS